jgi:hypothetical protein
MKRNLPYKPGQAWTISSLAVAILAGVIIASTQKCGSETNQNNLPGWMLNAPSCNGSPTEILTSDAHLVVTDLLRLEREEKMFINNCLYSGEGRLKPGCMRQEIPVLCYGFAWSIECRDADCLLKVDDKLIEIGKNRPGTSALVEKNIPVAILDVRR